MFRRFLGSTLQDRKYEQVACATSVRMRFLDFCATLWGEMVAWRRLLFTLASEAVQMTMTCCLGSPACRHADSHFQHCLCWPTTTVVPVSPKLNITLINHFLPCEQKEQREKQAWRHGPHACRRCSGFTPEPGCQHRYYLSSSQLLVSSRIYIFTETPVVYMYFNRDTGLTVHDMYRSRST